MHDEQDTDSREDPWALLPTEVVCADCHLAYHRPLGSCPTCAYER